MNTSETINSILRQAIHAIESASNTAQLDAEVLLAWVLHKNRAYILAHGEETLTQEQLQQFNSAVNKRAQGLPLAYIIGVQEFYGREFIVDERVLVPRPETELLIEKVLKYIKSAKIDQPRIVDIGTGSGCIAITLAKEIIGAQITAVDISEDALTVAENNAHKHNAKITFHQSDLFNALQRDKFDIIVSNPPYVNFDNVDEQSKESLALQHEPQIALTPQNDNSFSIVEQIIQESVQHISQNGALFIEIGADQGARAQETAEKHYPNANIAVHADLAGKDRLVTIFLPQ